MATVSELQAQASAAAMTTLAQAQGYLTALTNAANVVFSNPGFNIDSMLPAAYNYATVPEVNFVVTGGGIRPVVTDLGLTGAPEAPTISISTPVAILLPADDLLAPTHNFEFFEAAYQSTLLDPLRVKLLNDLLNGGYGIDTADEQALFQRARDREVEGALTRIDDAGRMMAARGFPLPPGELSIHIDRAYQDMQNKVSGVSRDIALERAKLFVENRQFTMKEVRDLETVLIGFHNSVQERALNVAKAAAEFSIEVYNALLARYKVRLEAAKTASDVQLQLVQADLARAQAAIELFRGQISGYEANLRFMVEPLKLQVDLYRADIEANKGIMDGVVAKAALQQKVLEATMQQNIQISGMTIELAKAKLLATVQALQFQTEAAKFGAAEFFATLTAMFGSINSLSVQSATE